MKTKKYSNEGCIMMADRLTMQKNREYAYKLRKAKQRENVWFYAMIISLIVAVGLLHKIFIVGC